MSTTAQTFTEAIQVERTNAKLFDCAMRAALEADQLREQLAASEQRAERYRLVTLNLDCELAAMTAERDQLREKLNATEDALIDGNIKAAATIRDNWQLQTALHQCLAATGEDAGDIDDFRALENRDTITVEAVREMRRELDQARQTIEDVCCGTRIICETCGKPRPCCCNDLG